MNRNHHALIEQLEYKAADRAVTEAERDALLAKAAQLRETYGAMPPRKPPRVTVAYAMADEPWSTSTGTTTTMTGSFTFTFGTV